MRKRREVGCGSMFLGCLVFVTAFAVLMVVIDISVRMSRENPGARPEVVQSQYPTGSLKRLGYEVQKGLRSVNTGKVHLSNGNLEITITQNDVPLLDPSEAEFQMEYTNVLRGIHESGFEDFSTVEFMSFVPLYDKYGNKQLLNVSIMTFDKSTLDRINWDNFLHINLTSLASDYSFHEVVNRRE